MDNSVGSNVNACVSSLRIRAINRWAPSCPIISIGARPVVKLPFKLHQFFSQTGAVYTTLDQDDNRKITLEPAVYLADEANKKPLFPNVFSRGSGHAYICVCKNPATRKLEPREFRATTEDDEEAADGYLIVGEDVWNPDEDLEMLPEGWMRETKCTDCWSRARNTVPGCHPKSISTSWGIIQKPIL